MSVGGVLLLIWVVQWVWRRRHPPAPPIPPQPIWYFDYTDKGKPFHFMVFADTEAKALGKYMKAGLDVTKITGSGPMPWPFKQ